MAIPAALLALGKAALTTQAGQQAIRGLGNLAYRSAQMRRARKQEQAARQQMAGTAAQVGQVATQAGQMRRSFQRGSMLNNLLDRKMQNQQATARIASRMGGGKQNLMQALLASQRQAAGQSGDVASNIVTSTLPQLSAQEMKARQDALKARFDVQQIPQQMAAARLATLEGVRSQEAATGRLGVQDFLAEYLGNRSAGEVMGTLKDPITGVETRQNTGSIVSNPNPQMDIKR